MGTGDKALIVGVVILVLVFVGIFGYVVADMLSDVGDAVGRRKTSSMAIQAKTRYALEADPTASIPASTTVTGSKLAMASWTPLTAALVTTRFTTKKASIR